MQNQITIFCDGASKGNPGPGGWGAVVVYPEALSKRGIQKVKELGGHERNTTNNRMELSAAIKALTEVKKNVTGVDVYTDSRYLINGITKWVHGWQKNNWQTKNKEDVLNKDLWEKLVELIEGKKVNWTYVGGHIGVAGNERCDEIASALAEGENVTLYDGLLSDYKIDVLNFNHDEIKKESKKASSKKSNSKAIAYSYVSLIKGVIYRDKTWPECEKRVKGAKGVKYQKAISFEHEREIIKGWGV